ncbi:aconitate hydratase [Anaeromyxobacter diazotrophicus]|uniref:Aconitate hydratase A n=1 Tax=Anaeromyxobacter diazotrophicus TaxID=2590199 RepID=A0A7I9VKF4_9BACT|nr:aconitate hydratase [Anaeromyxobacter diazotrophicus]GEJ56873.1 aconitate hydratase [Anaeromyxobacter diazotrophicus]
MEDRLGTQRELELGGGKRARYHALAALEQQGFGAMGRLPVSIRIVLESLARNCDGHRVREEDVRALAGWQPDAPRTREVPFVVGRVLLQDFTGVPLLVDLAAMRSAMARLGQDPRRVEPRVPVDLVIDHSVQVDAFGSPDALERNVEMEFHRNRQRYEFLKWGTQAFETFRIVPPGLGICHQVNLEYLARGVLEQGGVLYPDTLVGTDSHTTMINGLGIVGWGVGGIEAEAAMLGQPSAFLTPDVVGVHLHGALRAGVTGTDLVLTVTELLRRTKVVGKFVEFHGEGAAALPAPMRATIANMAPEYGATLGLFPVDEQTLRYFEATGRPAEQVRLIRAYYEAQGLFGTPRQGACDYSQVVDLDLASVEPSVAGPKRPQDRVPLAALKERFTSLLTAQGGFARPASELGQRYRGEEANGTQPGGGLQEPHTAPTRLSVMNTNPLTELEMMNNRPTPDRVAGASGQARLATADIALGHGDVVIAAITSCTNTSNPSVMLAAGLLAKKAVERGLRVKPTVKTSLAPGSRVVTSYLEKTGLLAPLAKLGFDVVGYGCTTCIGNSGPLDPRIEQVLAKHDLVCAAVLSGNRNFEARIHQAVKANFLMSPPLVVAFALAGDVARDLTREPLGQGKDGKDVYLRDVWPSEEEVQAVLFAASDPAEYRRNYHDVQSQSAAWNALPAPSGETYAWDAQSTYVREPPYFLPFSKEPAAPGALRGARALAIFGESVTTDHISPAGSIKPSSPAGRYLQEQGVPVQDFNSYGARRGNHEVMVRGTFANVRIKNLMVPGVEGGVTVHQPDGRQLSIHEAALLYEREGVPLVVLAGQEYGTGSSRDWAAKGTRLLGVRAVVARSFERIHRSNLVGMGVLPCQFAEGVSAESLGLDGTEVYDLLGVEGALAPRQQVTLVVHRRDGREERVPLTLRIDTPVEVEYFRHGGILPYVLRQLAARA